MKIALGSERKKASIQLIFLTFLEEVCLLSLFEDGVEGSLFEYERL